MADEAEVKPSPGEQPDQLVETENGRVEIYRRPKEFSPLDAPDALGAGETLPSAGKPLPSEPSGLPSIPTIDANGTAPIQIKLFSLVRADFVDLPPNTAFVFRSTDVGPGNLGALFTAGALTPAEGNPYPQQDPTSGWQRPFVWPKEGGEAAYVSGPEGVSFVCLSNTRGLDAVVQHHRIDGAFTVPFDWAYVVASGTVMDGSQQVEAGNYFAPHNLDREITGTADLLLVR